MKSLFRFILLLLALAAGFALGVFYQRSRTRPSLDLLQRVPITHAAASASRSVVVLRLLRAGQTERAATVLENYLDGDLIAFGPAYQGASSEQRASSWADAALREARAYRLAYPHPAQDAVIGQGVSATLALAPAP